MKTTHNTTPPLTPVETACKGVYVSGANIRPDKNTPGTWLPAGYPTTVRRDSWLPLQRLSLDDSGIDALFMLSGNMLGLITLNADKDISSALSKPVAEIGQCNGKPINISILEPGILRVLVTHSQTCYITYGTDNGTLTTRWHGAMPNLPAISLVKGKEAVFSHTIGPFKISGTAGNSLCEQDNRLLNASFANACNSIRAKAMNNGYFIQPTIARCRLTDAAGDTIAITAPVMLGDFQLCKPVTLKSDSPDTLKATPISARGYSITAVLPGELPAPWNKIVHNAIVESIPQIEPVNPDIPCSTTVTATTSTGMTVSLTPGGTSITEEAENRRHTFLVEKAIASALTQYYERQRIANPYSLKAGRTDVWLHDDETASASGYTPIFRDKVTHGICLPLGNMTVLGNRREEPCCHTPRELAVSITEEAGSRWQCLIKVSIKTGDGAEGTVIAADSGNDCYISGFSPILFHPDENATSISITLLTERNGARKITTETFPLHPTSGIGALHIRENLQPVLPRATTSDIEDTHTNMPAVCNRRSLEIYKNMLLHRPVNAFTSNAGAIAAIAEAPRSRSAWDFARSKFLLFGENGISIYTLDSNGKVRGSGILDNRSVRNANAVCPTNGTTGLELLAIAGHDLVRVSQSSVSTVMHNCAASETGWCSATGEIWLNDDKNGLSRIIECDGSLKTVKAEIPDCTAGVKIKQFGDKLFLQSNTGIFDTAQEFFPPSGVKAKLTVRYSISRAMPAGKRLRRIKNAMPRLLQLSPLGSRVAGEIEIKGDNGLQNGDLLTSLKISGSVTSPITIALASPARLWLETSATAFVSADAQWHSLQLFAH